MVIYNPKDWFSLIFKFHKSDTFRKLFIAIIAIGVYAGIICYIEIAFFDAYIKGSTALHSLLGFVISLLLVFRTNTAYDRWWEGRKAWGTLVNNSRNLAIKLHAFLPDNLTEERKELAKLIGDFPYALKEHLRNGVIPDELELTKMQKDKGLICLDHVPNNIALMIFQLINTLYRKGAITGEQLIVLNEEVKTLTDVTGICERIKRTPIPFSYSLFIKKFVFVYVMTLPFGFATEFKYWTIPITMFVFYVLVSIEVIAEEIEDPFGDDANDLPTDSIAERIKNDVREILG